MGEGSGEVAVRKFWIFLPQNGAFCMHSGTWLDSSKNLGKGKQVISVSVFKIISITVSVSFLRDHFYMYIVSVLKIFSVLVSVWDLLTSIISVSVWVSVTGISLSVVQRCCRRDKVAEVERDPETMVNESAVTAVNDVTESVSLVVNYWAVYLILLQTLITYVRKYSTQMYYIHVIMQCNVM